MTAFWRIWLIVWAWSVILFGVVIAGGAFEATSSLIKFIFETVQGGGTIAFDPVLRFSLGVMGGVTIGWGVTGLLAIMAAIRLGEAGQPVWNAITFGLVAWFIIDSSLSVATGFGLNVIPNVALLAGYLIAIFATGKLPKSTG